MGNKINMNKKAYFNHIVLFYIVSSMFFLELFLPSFLIFLQQSFNPLETLKVVMLGLALGALANIPLAGKNENSPDLIKAGLLFYSLAISGTFIFASLYARQLGSFIDYVFILPFFINSFILSKILANLDIRKCYITISAAAGFGCLSVYLFLKYFGAEVSLLIFSLGGVVLYLYSMKIIRFKAKIIHYLLFLICVIIAFTLGTNVGLRSPYTDQVKKYFSFPYFKGKGTKSSQDIYRGSGRWQRWPSLIDLLAHKWDVTSSLDIYRMPKEASCDPNKFNKEVIEKMDLYRTKGMVLSNFIYAKNDSIVMFINDKHWSLFNMTTVEPENMLKYFVHEPRTLVIGVGGGGDIINIEKELRAKEIIGVEIKADLVDLIKARHGQLLDPIITGKKIIAADGRNYVFISQEKYDLIFLSFSDLNVNFPNSLVQVENYLYTVEAIYDYWDNLSDKGILFFGYHINFWTEIPNALLRIATTSYKALAQMGLTNPGRHFIAFRYHNRPEDGGLLVSKSPLPESAVESFVASYKYPEDILYYPGIPKIDNAFSNFFRIPDKRNFFEQYKLDVTPITDNKPFFFDFDKTHKLIKKQSWLFLKVILSVCVAAILLAAMSGINFNDIHLFKIATVCMLISMAQALLEMLLVQRLNVYIGNPIYSLSVVLFSFFSFCGLGLYLFKAKRARLVPLVSSGLLIALGLAYFFLLTPMINLLKFQSIFFRIVISGILLLPISCIAGLPFPYVLDQLVPQQRQKQIPLILCLSSLAFAATISIAIMISIHHGYNVLWFIFISIYSLISIILVKATLSL
jgi:hypothetical protein